MRVSMFMQGYACFLRMENDMRDVEIFLEFLDMQEECKDEVQNDKWYENDMLVMDAKPLFETIS